MTNTANLADRYAELKAQIKFLQDQMEEVSKEIKSLGYEKIVGESHFVSVILAERSTLDTKLVREILTDDQVAACTKITLVESLRITEISKLPIAA